MRPVSRVTLFEWLQDARIGAYASLIGVVILLSSVTLVIKYIFQHSALPPVELASDRVLIGFVLLLAITVCWDWRGLVSLQVADLVRLGVVGILGVFSYAIAACGLMRTSVTHYALIYSLLPCCTALMSMAVGQDRLGMSKLAGMGLSLIGCVVAIGVPSLEGSVGSGDLLVLLFTVMMSAHIVASAGIVKRFGVMVANTVMFGNSTLILWMGSIGWEQPPTDPPSGVMAAAVVYVGVATAAVFLLRYRSLKYLSPATVGTYHNFVPVVTVLLACVLLDEPIAAQTIVGGIAVLAGAEWVRRAHDWPLGWGVLRTRPVLGGPAGSRPAS